MGQGFLDRQYSTIPVPLLSVLAVDTKQPDHVELAALLRQQ